MAIFKSTEMSKTSKFFKGIEDSEDYIKKILGKYVSIHHLFVL